MTTGELTTIEPPRCKKAAAIAGHDEETVNGAKKQKFRGASIKPEGARTKQEELSEILKEICTVLVREILNPRN